jgi:O-antigen/teichoic acid export membrane protein
VWYLLPDTPNAVTPMVRGHVPVAFRSFRAGRRATWVRRIGAKAAGAISGQVSQALASFVLQLIAARSLGASGLGMFAILYGAMVLGTAISSGLIGDSLTVLNRRHPEVRTALVRWSLIVALSSAAIAASAVGFSGALPLGSALLFGVATAVFVLEDSFRRLLMATLRFWSLLLVDGTSLFASIIVLTLTSLAGMELTIGAFMLALLVGQALAMVVAWSRLPPAERSFSLFGSARLREVFAFGSWRSVQLSIRPSTMVLVRLLVSFVVGVAAYGQLEAARICMAPALIIVSGIGALLLPMYASQKLTSTQALLRRADFTAAALLICTVVTGGFIIISLPLLDDVISGGQYPISSMAVAGWAVFAATTAATAPYTTLAAVRGRQHVVTAVRVLDPAISLLLVALALALAVDVVPFALATGTFLAGAALRWFVLSPMARVDRESRVDEFPEPKPGRAPASPVSTAGVLGSAGSQWTSCGGARQ